MQPVSVRNCRLPRLSVALIYTSTKVTVSHCSPCKRVCCIFVQVLVPGRNLSRVSEDSARAFVLPLEQSKIGPGCKYTVQTDNWAWAWD